MKWLRLLLLDPATALDWWEATHTHLDHGKVATDLILFSTQAVLMAVALWRREFPPVAWGIVLVSGAMGSRVFIAMLRSKSVTSTEQVVMDLKPLTRVFDNPDAK